MHLTFNPFDQPSVIGGGVDVNLIGRPVYPTGTIIRFIKYGVYIVTEVRNKTTLTPRYSLELVERYVGSPTSVPAGTVAYVEEGDLSNSTLTYSPTIFLDLRGPDYQSVSLDGDIVFAAQQHDAVRAITVHVKNTNGVSSRNLSFPASWIFLGAAGRPSLIGPSKTGILSVTCFGTSDADVIAVWGVQPDN